MLTAKNLTINIGNKKIIKGIDLEIKKEEFHVLMGPNGVGKTTFALGLMGDSRFKVQSSKFKVNGKNISKLKPEKRARIGLFVSFQNPVEIQDISVISFLRTAYNNLYPNKKIPLSEFKELIKQTLKIVGLKEAFMQRSINGGFSGGEKKRMEISQLLILKPKIAILDEIDSGLDADGLRILAKAIKMMIKKYKTGILLISHTGNITRYIKPNFVHVLINGEIRKKGDEALIKKIEKNGYAAI